METLQSSKLDFHVHLSAELWLLLKVVVMCAIDTSKVDEKRLIDQMLIDLKLHHAEVDLCCALMWSEVHQMVALDVHLAITVCFDETDLKGHGLLSSRGHFHLRLLQHHLEETSCAWSELNHIVLVMVDHINVSQVEVTRGKLFMVRQLVEIVREVSVLALLLEGARAQVCLMVLRVVDLVVSHLVKSAVRMAVHHLSKHLTVAVRVLKLRIVAHLTEVACVALVTVAHLRVPVVSAKAIALKIVAILDRDTHCVGLVVTSEHLDGLMEGLKAVFTLFAEVASEWRRAVAHTILTLLSLGKWIAQVLAHQCWSCLCMVQPVEAISVSGTHHVEIEVLVVFWLGFADQVPALCQVLPLCSVIDMLDLLSMRHEVEGQLDSVSVVVEGIRADYFARIDVVLQLADMSELLSACSQLPCVDLVVKPYEQA